MEEKKRDVHHEAMLFLGRKTLARNGMAGVLRVVEIGPEAEKPKEKQETA